jgi:hypothetical protein
MPSHTARRIFVFAGVECALIDSEGSIGWGVSAPGPALEAPKIWNKVHRTASHPSRSLTILLETGHKTSYVWQRPKPVRAARRTSYAFFPRPWQLDTLLATLCTLFTPQLGRDHERARGPYVTRTRVGVTRERSSILVRASRHKTRTLYVRAFQMCGCGSGHNVCQYYYSWTSTRTSKLRT